MHQSHFYFPWFQPIVSIASGRIIGYEALARRYDEKQNIVSAGNLFTSGDLSSERLREIDRQVRSKALQRFAEFQQPCFLSLNISAAWIDYITDFRDLPTLRMVQELNIDRSRVVVEISEADADLRKLKEVVKIYRRNGLRVAVDDFGAGFSQLERVMAINPDMLKIDMRLFKTAAKGGIARDVVHLLTRFGKRLGSHIIGEGVETDNEFMFGLNIGAQYLQGFLFSDAAPTFKTTDLYRQHIASLSKKFLKRKLPEESKKIQQINAVKELLYKLKEVLQDDFNLNTLATWNFDQYGVLRFYLCNNLGEQISPDFNFSGGKWFNNPHKIGFNWSWRPYFYEILALESCGDCDRVVISDLYKDFDTGLLCKTLSLYLDSERILMADMKADWD